MNPTQQRKSASPVEKTSQAGDQARAFTERPKTDSVKKSESRAAHDLFNLFTANIIQAKTDFVR